MVQEVYLGTHPTVLFWIVESFNKFESSDELFPNALQRPVNCLLVNNNYAENQTP